MKLKKYIAAGFSVLAMICIGAVSLPSAVVPDVVMTVNAADTNNSSQETATKLTLNEAYTDSLVTSSDVNWYKFTTESNGYYTVDFGRDFLDSSSNYWKMIVYKFDECISEIGTWSFTGNQTASSTNEIGIPAGEYFIKITSATYSTTTPYSITINFTETDDWETEFNDSMQTADEISLDTELNASLHKSGDTDWYKFTTELDGYFTIDFGRQKNLESSSSYWKMIVYKFDESINEISTWSFNGNQTKSSTYEIGIPAGEYYIKITSATYNSTVPYSLTVNFTSANDWETEFNDSMQTADEISLDETLNASLYDNSDTDWFKFTTESDGYFTVDFGRQKNLESSSSYWKMVVYKFDESINEIHTWSFGGNQIKSSTNEIGVPAGEYYIKITSATYNTAIPYSLTVNFTSASDWETEFNNTMQTADEINLSKTLNATLHNNSDTDWFKFTTESNGYFTVDFGRQKNLESSSNYWKMIVYKADEDINEIRTWSFTGNQTKSSTYEIGIPEGEYYIKVTSATYNSSIPYSLTVNFTSEDDWETEFNDTMQTADEINLNKMINASLHDNGDTDWFKFTVDTDGYFTVDFGRQKNLESSSSYWKMVLYKSDEGISEISNWSFKGNQTKSSTDEIIITAGEYYIKVISATYNTATPYSLTVNFNSLEPTNPDTIMGDVNLDGEFNVMDVVILQKWILAVKDVKLECWQNADFNKDDVIDVFDLCLMKHALIGQ